MRLLCLLTAVLHLLAFADCSDQIPLRQTQTTRRHVSPQLYADLEELSRIVDISYCVGTANTGISKPFNCLSRCSAFPSFELVTTWNSGPLFTDSCGYIALSHAPAAPRIIVAFRGTYSIANTVLDLATVPQEYLPYPASNGSAEDAPKCENCTVHLGFFRSWTAAQEIVFPHVQSLRLTYPDYKITLVGHSLGGAVAALAGLEFVNQGWNTTVTTFGEPRIGNAALADYLDRRFGSGDLDSNNSSMPTYRRVTHRNDPVPLLPPTEWGYVPHAGEIFINKTSLPHDIFDLVRCDGDTDPECSAGQDSSVTAALAYATEEDLQSQHLPAAAFLARTGFGLPIRYRLWQLLFAHRDYFWRLGVCLPELWPPW